MRIGLKEIKGTLTPKQAIWQKVYETTISSAVTTLNISGLAGDTDEIYLLKCKFVNDNDSVDTCSYSCFLNNDTTAANYGVQNLVGSGSDALAARNTSYSQGFGLSALNTEEVGIAKIIIYAKSGYVRIGICDRVDGIVGTFISSICIRGYAWNNTADNITSINLVASLTNGIGVGSKIELYKRSSEL